MKEIFNGKRLNKPIYICDIETDNLLEDVTKIHCLSYGQMVDNNFWVKTLTDIKEIKQFVSRRDITIVGHNFISYDNLVLEKLLGVKFELSQLIDSLYLSWALYPKLLKHGLEEWGNTLGIKKPHVADWKDPTPEEIKFRCESDVKINLLLWTKQFEYLTEIYESSFEHYIDFLMLISEIVVYQEQNPCKYDVAAANILLEQMETEKEQRIVNLKKIMPNVVKKTTKTIKSVVKISDTEYYSKGDLMYEHYLRLNYPIVDHKIVKIVGEDPPNPNSVPQKKAWLYSLGWIPTTFKKVKEKDGSKRPVEQIMSEEGDGSLCKSVESLFDIEPGLKELEGLSILTHRIGVVKGLNRDQRGGYIQASISGLTQTLRLKHSKLVNLVKPSKAYGKEIRGLIIAEDNGLLIGSDLANIESRTKNHFIYPYDPEYVKEMSDPLFDSHLDTAYRGELITKEDLLFYTWFNLLDKSNYDISLIEDHISLSENLQKKEISRIKNSRQIGKGVNFSCQYGGGPVTIAEQNKIPLKIAKKLHKAYHDRNKSVQQFANSLSVKTVQGQKWIFNPIFNMWYFLKADKDKFSAINQGTASALFMSWIKNCRDLGVFCRFNVHDEQIIYLRETEVEETKNKIRQAMDKINQDFQLNVTIDCSMDVGINYAEIH